MRTARVDTITVALVSGSWPPDVCGVGDYSANLSNALERTGISVHRIGSPIWNWGAREKIAGSIEATAPDVVHIQYPTRGYASSRVPAWLMWRLRHYPRVATLHEYSAQVGPPLFGVLPRGLPHYLPLSTANATIFSSEHERNLVAGFAPWIRKRAHILPIGSNIPRLVQSGDRRSELLHFGQICPGKGIESFEVLARLMRSSQTNLRTALIGSVPFQGEAWADAMTDRLRDAGVTIEVDLPEEGVAERMNQARFAYLPFPDGASAKRGSLIAALVNGMVVLTPHRDITPSLIRACTLHAEDPTHAALLLEELSNDPQRCSEIGRAAREGGARCGWERIAEMHREIYVNVLARA